MAVKLVRSYCEPFSRKRCREFVDMNRFIGDRPLRQPRVQMLRNKITEGTFHTPKWAFCWLNGTKIRVNGQNSSHVLDTTPDELIPDNLSISIDEFVVDSIEDVATLFEQFDPPGSGRGRSEVINAHARTEASLSSVPTQYVVLGVDALAVHYEINYRSRLNASDRARLVHDEHNIEFIVFLRDFAKCDELRRATVGAAIYASWSVDQEAALEFWSAVMQKNHPDPQNPTRVLFEWLAEFKHSTRVSKNNGPRRHTNKYVYDCCVHAWNAWRRGQTRKLVKTHRTQDTKPAQPI